MVIHYMAVGVNWYGTSRTNAHFVVASVADALPDFSIHADAVSPVGGFARGKHAYASFPSDVNCCADDLIETTTHTTL